MKALVLQYLLFLLLPTLSFAQYISIDDSYTAQQLVQNVLINSDCANVSNFSASGDTFSGSEKSYAFFTSNGSSFPFATGIVLATSRASRTPGPNDNLIDEGSTEWLGDLDLEQSLDLNYTVNATVLEFDFVPLTSQISFDYIFASEEYQGTAPCKYSDGFAFLLKPAGSTVPYQNLAVVPNTSIPVSVTTVHPLIPSYNGCDAQNEEYFSGYNNANHPINFNGQTVVMTAKGNVVAGQTYHIKLVIADDLNIRYDSAIFLKGGSFDATINLGIDKLTATNNPLCAEETLLLDATIAGLGNTYQWTLNSTEIPGATNPTYLANIAGNYSVTVNLSGTSCVAKGEIKLEYATPPIVNAATIVQCDPGGNGSTSFNLTHAKTQITSDATNIITYYSTLIDAELQQNPILISASFQSVPTTIFATVQNLYGCISTTSVELLISNESLPIVPIIHICDTDTLQDGFSVFNLPTQISDVILPNLPNGLQILYYANEEDALLQQNSLPNNFENTTAYSQIIYAKIVNGSDCYGIIKIKLEVKSFPNFTPTTQILCENSSSTLSVASGFESYSWNIGQITNSIQVNSPGTYFVTVTNSDGCTATKTFTVTLSNVAVITNVLVKDFAGPSNSAEIHYEGIGTYQFSIDGINYQGSPLFQNIVAGTYQAYIKENDCGSSKPFRFYVLDYPRFFTPNSDGTNDFWTIKNFSAISGSRLSIFDRYGKVVFIASKKQDSWDGLYRGKPLPSTDYWFTLQLKDGSIHKGHFTLKR